MYVPLKRGIFKNIELRHKIIFSCIDLVKRPKIYNDRRIFHPNIKIETLEIIVPKLVLDGIQPKSTFLIKQTSNINEISKNVLI